MLIGRMLRGCTIDEVPSEPLREIPPSEDADALYPTSLLDTLAAVNVVRDSSPPAGPGPCPGALEPSDDALGCRGGIEVV